MTEAQGERIAAALERLVVLLEFTLVQSDETVAADAPCTHSEDLRVSFGVTAGVEDFQCRACGYRSVGEQP